MKILSTIFLFVPVMGLKVRAPSTTAALRVPRGGAFPIKPDPMVKIFCSFYALNGALSLPAPESAKDFALQEGTADYVAFENLGAVSISYATLVYLSAFSHKSAADVIGLSSLPLAYVSYKNVLKGLSVKLSGSKVQGPVTTAFLIACIYCILKGKGNAENIATALAVLPFIIGLVSEFDLESGMKLSGFGASISGKKGQAIFVWYVALLAGFGALSLARLHSNLSAMDAIGYAALLETFFMIDCIWLRKWNIGVAPSASNYVFLGIPVLTALAILLNR